MVITIKEYAEKQGLKYTTAYIRLKRHGKRISRGVYEVEENDAGLLMQPKGVGGKLSQNEINRIKRLIEKEYPLWAIAEKVGCCEETVRKYARSNK